MLHSLAIALTAPWILLPAVALVRATHSRSLDDEPADPSAPTPRVSVVIPARNEAHNIERCASSVLASSYSDLEVIVVDDHSTDDTGEIAAGLARSDARLRVVTPPPLPSDWFGKQWACSTGASVATGSIIGFLDADTWQSPDLVPRVVLAMHSRGADLLSVAGRQELGTFWERVLQPHVFATFLQRYGGTESMNRSPRASDKIANGQCLFVRREAYDAIGGHASVRNKAAEDLAIAQRFHAMGRRVSMVLGLDQLSTRMYTSLRGLIDGWGKNVYAGGIDAMPGGAIGRAIFPIALFLPSISAMLPAIMLVLSLAGLFGGAVLTWAAITTVANLAWWAVMYRSFELPMTWALLHPLGGALFFYIALGALIRGRKVRWKGREYRAA